ncbi:hypothetical protein QWJ34_16385 [Saccharibacillus sp. CPCC 101409]|uniref:hypothetical protein n=1 Tax=Saccharibacillus sp. CPCC 101409 TaxID=3058041 RepID=UPI002673EDF9|nr:hypothetical protein [Saccharibacillus sp. CPCC 101409]MDO3411345.1 hypothetical protein [Saccharibacillus sp. CPCC 101409]
MERNYLPAGAEDEGVPEEAGESAAAGAEFVRARLRLTSHSVRQTPYTAGIMGNSAVHMPEKYS